nr:hypothetical protein [Tanacetum cinerariifolium]
MVLLRLLHLDLVDVALSHGEATWYGGEQSGEATSDVVMDAPTIPISVNSSKGNFGDAIDIGVDVVHPVPVAAVSFPALTIVTTLARHGEAIRGIHKHLQGVPIKEDMSTL